MHPVMLYNIYIFSSTQHDLIVEDNLCVFEVFLAGHSLAITRGHVAESYRKIQRPF